MGNIVNLAAEEGADIIGDDASPALTVSNTVGPSLEVKGPTTANASIGGLKLTNGSVASGAVLSLGADSFVSCTTIKFTTGAVAGTGAIRVVLTDGSLGWIPILPDTAVTAAAQS